jgi:hypothetical protein
MSSSKFSPFYEALFGDGFRIENAQDIAKCMAYARYQANKKQFAECPKSNPAGDVHSSEVKAWSAAQDVSMYVENVTKTLEDLLQKTSEIEAHKLYNASIPKAIDDIKQEMHQSLKGLQTEFIKATGLRQTITQGFWGTVFMAVLAAVLFKVVPSGLVLIDKVTASFNKTISDSSASASPSPSLTSSPPP